MTNSRRIADQLSTACDGNHEHQALIGGRAKEAAIYPRELCEAIIQGLKEEMEDEKGYIMNLVEDIVRRNTEEDEGDYYIDDVYGKVLDTERVREARRKEMAYIIEMGVYEKVKIEEAYERTGKAPIKLRWIDTNKSNDENEPNYRSRLVAKEFNNGQRLDLYSATPPLELIRSLLALGAIAQWDPKAWGAWEKPEFKYTARGSKQGDCSEDEE
eukprot:1945027-Karenia_brevis.AAC.1